MGVRITPMGEIGHGSGELELLLTRARRGFAEVLGPGPAPRVFQAPGRVNLMGAHLDYNGGPALPLAIDLGTRVAARIAPEPVLRLASAQRPERLELPLGALPGRPRGDWTDYPVGVLRGLAEGRAAPLPGLELFVDGDLPVGGGLSSSASLCVATALACGTLAGEALAPEDLADLAWRAERDHVGLPCGPLDPHAVARARAGHLLWLECDSLLAAHLPVDSAHFRVAVADSGVPRSLAGSAYADRVARCRAAQRALEEAGLPRLVDATPEQLQLIAGAIDGETLRRARHVVTESGRTRAARRALAAGDLAGLGRLMLETHTSLREDYGVSCPELDLLVDSAAELDGVHGARLTGAGFGGCVAILLEPGSEERVEEALGRVFERHFGRRPDLAAFGCGAGPRELRGG